MFENDWINKIDNEIIKEFYKLVKIIDENVIRKELIILKKYYKLENISDLVIQKILDEIVIFSKKEEILYIVKSCLYFISELSSKKTDFSKKLNQLRDVLSKNINFEEIKTCGKLFKNYGINILNPKPEEREYLDILKALYNKKGSIKFLIKFTDKNFLHLQEVVSLYENIFLTKEEILDISKCSHFMDKILGNKNSQKDDSDLIISFIKKIPQTQNISRNFISYSNNYEQIQKIFSQKFDKSQAGLEIIKNILNHSIFKIIIKNKEELYFKFNGTIINEKKKKNDGANY